MRGKYAQILLIMAGLAWPLSGEATVKVVTTIQDYAAIAREIGDRRNEATSTGNLGNVFWSQGRCEEALAVLGKLMACSRQLDMLIANTRIAHEYAERFLAGDYETFR